jgi:hypothetical protein
MEKVCALAAIMNRSVMAYELLQSLELRARTAVTEVTDISQRGVSDHGGFWETKARSAG